MKIAVVVNKFGDGGITPFAVNLINYLAKKNNYLKVFYFGGNKKTIDKLPKTIELKRIHKANHKSLSFILFALLNGAFFDLIRILFRKKNSQAPIKNKQKIALLQVKCARKIKEKFDVCISTSEFFTNYFVARKVNAKKKIAWIHPDISKLEISKKISLSHLKQFSSICLVSSTCKDNISELFPEIKDKFVYIPNIVNFEEIRTKSRENFIPPTDKDVSIKFVTVCRMDNSSKRIDRIIRIAKFLAEKRFSFIWYLVGDGKDLSYIKSLVDNSISENLIFFGQQQNPYKIMVNADVFVLLSQYEGKPYVVEEALALGLPCIVTNYSAAKEQVDENNGFIIANDDNLISNEFWEILNNNSIKIFRKTESKHSYDNSEAFKKIDLLIDNI